MPVGVLTMLATIAGLFAAYSLNCYLFVRNNWRRYLGVIMTANVLYCLLSVGLTVKYYELLTPVGIAYFAGEVVVIGVLVGVERKRLILYST